jgi:hypothetical protein
MSLVVVLNLLFILTTEPLKEFYLSSFFAVNYLVM